MILSPRFLPRLAATVGLFTRYGLRDFASQQGLVDLAPDEGIAGNGAQSATDVEARAEAFRKRLVELGPAYIKLGQVLSTRPDLLPSSYIEELQRLQDDVAPIPFADIEGMIETELGARIGKLFAAFEHEPLGSASLGQAHAATLRDGREVVVKVQRPEIRATLADDMEFFRELARFLSEHTAAGAKVDMIGIIQQLERALADELDYRVEARNGALLRRSLAEFPHIVVPKVIEGYTTERVLTTERVRGVRLDAVPPVTRTEYDFRVLADEFAKGYLKQITIDGHFHADPHPGNIFVILPGPENPPTPAELVDADRRAVPRPAATPLGELEVKAQREAASTAAAPEEPRLALIDFGMTARLSPEMRDRIVRLLFDLGENRGEAVASTLVEIGEPLEGFDRAAFVRETASLIASQHDRTIGDLEAGAVLYQVLAGAYQRGLRLPAELTLLAKTLFSLDGVARALDATYNPTDAIRTYAAQIMNTQAKRELSPRRLFQIATQTSELVNALPHRLDVITQRLASNELGIRVDAPQLGQLLTGFQKVANRVFSGLVLGGLLVASAMLYPNQRQLGMTGFLVAGAIGLYMIATILISDRKRERR
jgi:ubiquinone biosynthesis protein